jgi:4-amino-4-deoxy-L-arabinose transferase-like glycosyltransferase
MRVADRRLLVCAALLGFALRFGYAAATGALRHPQVWETEQIATNLIEGRGFSYEAWSLTYRSYAEPMYPYLAAAIYLVTGHSRTALVLVQLLIASLMIYVGGRAAALAANDEAAGVVAAVLLAVHPGLIRYSSVLHPFVLDAFFFLAAGAALVRCRQRPTLGRSCAAAALIGLGALTRPTILIFLLPLWWIGWRSRESVGAGLRRIAIVTATALALVAPWTIRNAVVQHEFMLTRSGTGFVFWLGNNPASSGSAADAGGRSLLIDAPDDFQQRIYAADETTRDRIFREAAWQYIRANPAAAAGRVAQRLFYFWWFSPQWGSFGRNSSTAKLVYRCWWGALLLLVGAGLVAAGRATESQRRDLLLLAALAVLVSLVQSLYYVEGRHRLAVEPLVVPLAAVGAIFVVESMTGYRLQRPLSRDSEG